jgi:hypothetical protein
VAFKSEICVLFSISLVCSCLTFVSVESLSTLSLPTSHPPSRAGPASFPPFILLPPLCSLSITTGFHQDQQNRELITSSLVACRWLPTSDRTCLHGPSIPMTFKPPAPNPYNYLCGERVQDVRGFPSHASPQPCISRPESGGPRSHGDEPLQSI